MKIRSLRIGIRSVTSPGALVGPRLFAAAAAAALLFLPAQRASAEDPRLTALLVQGDAEEAHLDSKAALAAFLQADKIDPNDIQVLLRIAKQYSDLVPETHPPDAAAQLAQNALSYAKRAVAIDPNNAKAHLCIAVCWGRMCDFVDNKTKLEAARVVHDEALRSLALDQTDDFTYHVLGRWNYGVANLNPFLKLMAKVMYDGLPPASNEEAIRYLKQAVELAPHRIIHHRELAKAYVAVGKTDLARKEWETILQLPVAEEEDEQAQKIAKENLKR